MTYLKTLSGSQPHRPLEKQLHREQPAGKAAVTDAGSLEGGFLTTIIFHMNNSSFRMRLEQD